MKTCDILCTDGKVVDSRKLSPKTRLLYSRGIHESERGTSKAQAMPVYLKDIEPFAYS